MKSMTQGKVREELVELDKKHYFHPLTPPKVQVEEGPPIVASEGERVYVKDVNGDTYIDGMSMLWNVNLGHGNKELAQASFDQVSKLAYSSSFNGYSHEPAILLAKKLSDLAPGDLNVVFYTSGGSESNESAFKIARYYWKTMGQPNRNKIISLNRGYHGVTMGATSATGMKEFNELVSAKAPEFFHAQAHLTECERGDRNHPDYEKSIRHIIEQQGADQIAAVIIEPVLGAGGLFIPPEGYLKAVRDLCDEHGILMITDEVITGFGRTGKMFGVNNWDVVPDMMTVAKGLTSGYSQLGAVILQQKIHNQIVDAEDVFFHGFTYSGHPTACTVALKNIEIIERDNIVDHVKEMEGKLKTALHQLAEKHPTVTKTRALGLLGAFELYADRDKDVPFDSSIGAAFQVVEECFKRKLILRFIDWEGSNTVVIAPPLITNKEELGKMIEIIDEVLTNFEQKVGIS